MISSFALGIAQNLAAMLIWTVIVQVVRRACR